MVKALIAKQNSLRGVLFLYTACYIQKGTSDPQREGGCPKSRPSMFLEGEPKMKKSLIALVALQACATSLAFAGSRRPSEVGPIVLSPEPGEQATRIKLNLASENDDALCLKPGTHRRLGDKRPIHGRDLNPVSIIKRSGGGSKCLPVSQVATSRMPGAHA